MASASLWTVANLPSLEGPEGEAATSDLVTALAVGGTLLYALSAARYWASFRNRPNLLPITVIACFLHLSEAMIGVAVTGERKWHASSWEWHGLIVLAYVVVGLAASREWRDERFRRLYLPTTRARNQEVSVLFADLVDFTSFGSAPRPPRSRPCSTPTGAPAAPLISRQFGGELEKFNRRCADGDVQQPGRPARSRAPGESRRLGNGEHGGAPREPGAGGRCVDRSGDVSAAPGRCSRRALGRPAHEGQGRPGRRVSATRAA